MPSRNSFSNRIGVTQPKSVIQVDSIDGDLKNSLWNALTVHYWMMFRDRYNSCPPDVQNLWTMIWVYYFKDRYDELEEDKDRFLYKIKTHFFTCEWYDVYNFLEFVFKSYQPGFDDEVKRSFIEFCNAALEVELSGYRFLDGILTPITSAEEMESINQALNISDRFKPVKIHLSQAQHYLSDKVKPDFRNSVKESICAVEAICRILTNEPKATLGQALKLIERKVVLHPAYKSAFSNLYGFSSDQGGIRHVA